MSAILTRPGPTATTCEPVQLAGLVPINAEGQWVVSGDESTLEAVEQALPHRVCTRAGPILLLRFINGVGRYRIPGVATLDVQTGKWSEQSFEGMLADLTRIAVSLPFSAGSSSQLPYDRTIAAQGSVLYHSFIYLRHVLSDRSPAHQRLASALQAILMQPHRKLQRLHRRTQTHLARAASAETFTHLAQGRGGMYRSNAIPALSRPLRGHLPIDVLEPVVESTLDTPENRFVKAFLDSALALIDKMVSVSGAHTLSNQIAADAKWMKRTLNYARQNPMWSEVRAMSHFPAASTVLHSRRGYRDVFQHSIRMRMAARVPVSREDVVSLLENKDIALMYELWCLFTLIDAVTATVGQPANANLTESDLFQVATRRGLEVNWPGGTRVLYNPGYSRNNQTQRSWSLPLRPDMALYTPNDELHLFDAKFRVNDTGPLLDENEDVDEDERQGVFKRADVYKMHTYRDAITDAQSAWVMYPGTLFQRFDADEKGAVGAIPVKPGQLEELHRHIASLLRV
jgi:predicted component of viral defense system (DUF524 family)